MGFKPVLVYHSPSGRECPPVVRNFANDAGLALNEIHEAEEVVSLVNRSFPTGIVMEADHDNGTINLCSRIKSDPFSAIVPIILTVEPGQPALVIEGLEAGADEVIPHDMEARE